MHTRNRAASVLSVLLGALFVLVLRAGWMQPGSSDASETDQRGRESDTPASAADGGDDSGAAARVAPLPVGGVVVHEGPLVLAVHGTGRAVAVQRAALSSRVGERVRTVAVKPGQSVAKGDVLVELDPVPFELALREAEAARGRAELEFQAQVFADPDDSAQRHSRVADRVGLTEAEQRVERARLDLEGAVLRAPFSGEVVSVEVAPGERVQAGSPLVTLVSSDPIRLPVEVLEADFGRLRPGASADVRFPALAGEAFTGRIAALGPEIDPSRGTGVAYLELANPGGRIRPGMYAEVALAAGLLEHRIAVPREAVLERDHRTLVFRVRDGRAEWSYVETGVETDDEVEVLSGVADGDTVLVSGHLTLAHGAPVRVTEE
ncbi:MAG: efflux RND transporter periplasmic adaptor subunit [Candidatus Eisenbacteria bacterium]|uniref:Efflux RND transporter periplasmic adaptor subunit n=1 Tax=Eiseniibacteriota bacterium TaxID=2212470 RepID=A0A956RPI3_UNCEI|nr:efflux RND transporter periplasmic adaptor subunit [Candidatus Eisenbacteria bacterium]